MGQPSLLQQVKYAQALVPVADYTAGNVETDIYSMANWSSITFFVFKGAGAAGTATVTIQACSTITATLTDDIAYRYSSNTATDVIGDLTDVAATGVTITAGANQIWAFTVNADELTEGYQFVRMVLTEVDSTAVTGCVLAVLSGGRDQGDDLATVIA